MSKITKYNRVPLGFDPSVARLLGHDPTPRPTCPVVEDERRVEVWKREGGMLEEGVMEEEGKGGREREGRAHEGGHERWRS